MSIQLGIFTPLFGAASQRSGMSPEHNKVLLVFDVTKEMARKYLVYMATDLHKQGLLLLHQALDNSTADFRPG